MHVHHERMSDQAFAQAHHQHHWRLVTLYSFILHPLVAATYDKTDTQNKYNWTRMLQLLQVTASFSRNMYESSMFVVYDKQNQQPSDLI